MGPMPRDDLGQVDTVGVTRHMDVGQGLRRCRSSFRAEKPRALVGIGLIDDAKARVPRASSSYRARCIGSSSTIRIVLRCMKASEEV